MSNPKIGMHYETVRKKLKTNKCIAHNPNIKESMINQARLHEGEGAAKELKKEFSNPSSNKEVRKLKTMNHKSKGNFSIGVSFCPKCHRLEKYCECDKEESPFKEATCLKCGVKWVVNTKHKDYKEEDMLYCVCCRHIKES